MTEPIDQLPPPAKPSSHFGDRVTLISLVVFVAFLAIWEWGVVPLFKISPALLPTPSQIIPSLWDGFASGYLLPNMLITLEEVFLGFFIGAVFGFVIAIPVAEFPAVERVASPYVVALQAIPKVAIAPLLVVWFGFGLPSKVVIVALITFFPIFVNAVAGLRNTPLDQEELFQIYRASRWQRFRFLRLPNSLSFIFAGLNVAVTLSVIGAIVGEFVGAQEGLGSVILKAGFALDTPGIFASVTLLTVIAAGLSLMVQAIGRWIVFWPPGK